MCVFLLRDFHINVFIFAFLEREKIIFFNRWDGNIYMYICIYIWYNGWEGVLYIHLLLPIFGSWPHVLIRLFNSNLLPFTAVQDISLYLKIVPAITLLFPPTIYAYVGSRDNSRVANWMIKPLNCHKIYKFPTNILSFLVCSSLEYVMEEVI